MAHEKEVKLPAVVPAVLFIAGLAASSTLQFPVFTAAGVMTIALLALGVARARRGPLFIALFGLAAGLLHGAAHARREADFEAAFRRLDPDRFVVLQGELTSGWLRVDYNTRMLRLEKARVTQDEVAIGIDREIAIYAADRPDVTPNTLPRTRTIEVEGFLRRSQRGALYVSVKSERLVRYSGEVSAFNPTQWNRAICARLDAVSGSDRRISDAAEMVKALALGHSESLSPDLKRSYREGGTYHLLVFSGMQIAIAAAVLLFFLRWLRRPRVGDWLLLVLATLAPSFAGNEPSVSRASLMIGLYAFTRVLHRPTHFANLIFVSAVVRLIAHPEELTDGGFILTYAATAGLVLIGGALASLFEPRRRLLRALARGAGAELALLPVTQWLFHRVIAGSSIITFLAAPLVGAMLATSVAFCFAAFFFPQALIQLARLILLLDGWCRFLNSLVGQVGLTATLPSPSSSLVLVCYGTTLVTLLLARRPLRALAALPLVVPFGVTILLLHSADVAPHVELLDVGQGDAILLRSGRTAVLVDGGGNSDDDTFGERVLLPLLLQRNVRALSAVVLTHPHPDHCGGLTAVLREIDVAELWLPGRLWKEGCTRELFELARRRGTDVRVAEKSSRLAHPGIAARIITPRLRFKRAAANNGSTVLDVVMEKRRILLTGDIERDGERLLIDDYPDLRADIVKIAHHGSRTSTGVEFLDAIKPRIALVSCGRENLYGHPAPEVLGRLAERRIQLFRTDRQGSVRVDLANRRVDTSGAAD